MTFHRGKYGLFRLLILSAMLYGLRLPFAAMAQSEEHGGLADEPLVDVSKIDPAIVIDLRYATARNITTHPIYPAGTPCLLRRGVAEKLKAVQAYLRPLGFNLKIW